MKYIFIGMFAFLSGIASAQSLELSTTNVNFGNIPIKPRSEQSVILRNKTPKPIVLKSVSVDCTCTKVEWSKRPINAGDSTIIKIIYTPSESGVFYKKIKIASTESDQTIIIRGVVK